MLARMSDFFDYVRHPHVDQRTQTGPPKVAQAAAALHGPGPIGRFNTKVGLKITLTFLQLVLLPIIIVGQNVQAAAADDRSLATYNDASAVLEEAKQIQLHLKVQDDAIQQILATLSAVKLTETSAVKLTETPTDRRPDEGESHQV